jgi:hypothetical protein
VIPAALRPATLPAVPTAAIPSTDPAAAPARDRARPAARACLSSCLQVSSCRSAVCTAPMPMRPGRTPSVARPPTAPPIPVAARPDKIPGPHSPVAAPAVTLRLVVATDAVPCRSACGQSGCIAVPLGRREAGTVLVAHCAPSGRRPTEPERSTALQGRSQPLRVLARDEPGILYVIASVNTVYAWYRLCSLIRSTTDFTSVRSGSTVRNTSSSWIIARRTRSSTAAPPPSSSFAPGCPPLGSHRRAAAVDGERFAGVQRGGARRCPPGCGAGSRPAPDPKVTETVTRLPGSDRLKGTFVEVAPGARALRTSASWPTATWFELRRGGDQSEGRRPRAGDRSGRTQDLAVDSRRLISI